MSERKIRIGLVGYGNIGSMHAKNLCDHKIPRANLAAICDIDASKRQKAGDCFPSIPLFSSLDDMLQHADIDALLIATPHKLHCEMAIAAFEHGLHVLTEKPAGIRPSDVKAMNLAAEKSGKVFGIMFNQRTHSLFQKAKELVDSGALGEKKRLTWIVTNWYRTQSYYDSGAWRATWQGEGGGVLTNQSPHNLDIAAWLFGMPKTVSAFCHEGRYHNISVEDFAMIHGEYENGATMQFITGTGEYPGTNRLELVGDSGKIVIEEGKLKYHKLLQNEKTVRFSSSVSMPKIPYEYSEYTSDKPDTAHCGILENFVSSILDGTSLLAPGKDGIRQVMLTSAAYLSAWTNTTVSLPIDDALYNKLLQEKQEKETEKHALPSENDSDHTARWTVNW
ncbi:MAG: Gfo/Idh/MocA family oxidoreductase [Clostridia bacterium]|nr:Gfo/Idh/MocA family oxidoreductase [Clostridia bacterium]